MSISPRSVLVFGGGGPSSTVSPGPEGQAWAGPRP